MNEGAVIGILIALVSFFLYHFWGLVDEMRRDLKEVLTHKAARDETINVVKLEIKDIKSEIKEIKSEVVEIKIDVVQLLLDVKKVQEKPKR